MNEQQRLQPDHDDDDDQWITIPSDDDTKILLQKAWCHGQSIAPPILGGLVVFVSRYNDNPNRLISALILALVMSWPAVSWRAMQHPSSRSLRRILVGGAVILALYVYMLGMILHWHSDESSSSGVKILLLVFLSLMVVETIAYLAVVWYHRPWFERGQAR